MPELDVTTVPGEHGGRSSFKPRLSIGDRPKGLLDDLELVVAKALGRNLRAVEAIVLRLGILVLIVVLFVNLLGPLSAWLGEVISAPFVERMRQGLPTPS